MTRECDNACVLKPITLFMNMIGKKLMMSVVFQNPAEQAIVLLSVNWSSSFALNGVNKVPEDKVHHIYLTVVTLSKYYYGRIENYMKLSVKL